MGEKRRHWHTPFDAAMRLELKEYREELEFKNQHELSREPLRIDLLIIKKNADVTIANEIGQSFRGHNIIEYKSEDDALNIDILYKVLGYACIYKAQADTLDGIGETDITVTLVRVARPAKLLGYLKETYDVSCPAKGIYRIRGMQFPVQILATSKLDEKNHAWLRALSSHLSMADAENFLRNAGSLKGKADKMDAHTIFDVVSEANEELFKRILTGGDDAMSEALRKLVEPELEELDSLRLMLSKKDEEITGKDAEIASKDAEIARLRLLLADTSH